MAVAAPPESAGSVPPHNEEAEASVLGAILLTEQALDGVLLEIGLRPEHFYRPRHQHIFEAMIRLKEKADPEAVDALTVSDDLRSQGVLEEAGGEAYVHSLPTVVPAVGAVLDYARIVRDDALMRGILETTRQIQTEVLAHRGEPRELIERAEAALFRIGHEGGMAEMRIDRVGPPRGDRQARGALAQGHRPHRHPVRLHGHRRPDRRLPARQPDRARRAALDGQEHARHQHRRERRHRARQVGRPVLARDVRDRARAPLHRLPGQGLERRPAQGPRQGRPLAEGAARRREARAPRRSSSTTRATSACSRCAPRRAACTPGTAASG